MARPVRASFVAFHATAGAARVISAQLRKRGFVELVPGVMWRRHTLQTARVWRSAALAIRQRLRNEPFVVVRFVGESPRHHAQWIAHRNPPLLQGDRP